MKRVIIAGILGGILYHAWGFAAWMVLPIHDTLGGIPNEAQITDALRDLETGVYTRPVPPEDGNIEDKAFVEAYEKGPIYTVFYHKKGGKPMSMMQMLIGLATCLAAALLAARLLAAADCCNTYMRRVGFVMALGVFLALATHVMYWNWMYFPLAYTISFIIDVVIGWTLVGLVMSAIVRPIPPQAAGEAE